MPEQSQMYELRRNPEICSGERSCGICGEHIAGLKNNGRVKMAAWSINYNHRLLDKVMDECPVGALELVGI